MSSGTWHAMEAPAVLAELKADAQQGITPAEAQSRLAQHGPNELTHEERASPWQLFFNQFKNVLVVIIIIATVLSAFVGEYVDAAIILVIIIFSAVLGFVQQSRADKASNALKYLLPPVATAI